MALIRCPECERGVSDRAAACPGCGCPIRGMMTHTLVVPQDEFRSRVGNYLRLFSIVTWIGAGMTVLYYLFEDPDEIGVILTIALSALGTGLLARCIASFFDDVYGIRKSIQGMKLEFAMTGGQKIEQKKVQEKQHISTGHVAKMPANQPKPVDTKHSADVWQCECGTRNLGSRPNCWSCGKEKP